MTIFEKIARRIDGFRDDMIDLQVKLCAIPAIAPASGGEGEVKKAEFLLDFSDGRASKRSNSSRHLTWTRRRATGRTSWPSSRETPPLAPPGS
jgi:hypothetical protein